MQKIDCKLTGFGVTKLEFEVSTEKHSEALNLTVEEKLQCRKPRDPQRPAGLMELIIKISDADLKFKLSLTSKSIFSFNERPDDEEFDTIMKDKCYPLAKERVNRAIKEITTAMGITPLDLSK